MLETKVIGNIGADAEVKDINGRKVINFNVAHSEKYTTSDGVKMERTTWVQCSIWRNADQSIEVAKYLTKGTKVYCSGKSDAQGYVNNDGEVQGVLKLMVRDLELLGESKGQKGNSATTTKAVEPAAQAASAPAGNFDDLP